MDKIQLSKFAEYISVSGDPLHSWLHLCYG